MNTPLRIWLQLGQFDNHPSGCGYTIALACAMMCEPTVVELPLSWPCFRPWHFVYIPYRIQQGHGFLFYFFSCNRGLHQKKKSTNKELP